MIVYSEVQTGLSVQFAIRLYTVSYNLITGLVIRSQPFLKAITILSALVYEYYLFSHLSISRVLSTYGICKVSYMCNPLLVRVTAMDPLGLEPRASACFA
jgi:hypothetical protein